ITETEEMEKFTHLEALLFTAVLENCVDQLSILGYIMPVSYEGKTDISHVCVPDTIVSAPIKYSCVPFLPGRQYASDVITVTMKKMQELGKFNSLTEANEREKAKKSKFHDFLIRSVLCSVLSCLTAQSQNNMIAYLRDELQEMKTKMNMESRYMKKSTDLQVHQTQKKCSNAENVLDKEIQKLRTQTDEEIRVHMEIENFLRQHHKVEEKLEYWSDKYENDTDAKDKELDALKAAKANNLEMLQRLAEEVRQQQHLRAHPCKTGFFLPSFRYGTRTMEKKKSVTLRCRVRL
uniref:IQ motif containing G n=1 Tax=Bubo bubo TaxID=30461 RepID=A0A8C0EI59_BUBBB